MNLWRRYRRAMQQWGVVATFLDTGASRAPDFREIQGPPQQVLVVDLGAMRITAGIYSLLFYIASVDEPTSYVRSGIKVDCARGLAKIGAVTFTKPGESKFSVPMNAPGGWRKTDSDGMSAQIADLVCASPDDRGRYAARMAQTDWQSAIEAALAVPRKQRSEKAQTP